jgi:hypothetical protein
MQKQKTQTTPQAEDSTYKNRISETKKDDFLIAAEQTEKKQQGVVYGTGYTQGFIEKEKKTNAGGGKRL